MRKLLKKGFMSMMPVSNNVFILGGINDFIIYDYNRGTVLYNSPYIKNLSTVLCNETQNAVLAISTSGKTLLVNNETVIRPKIKTRTDILDWDCFSENNNFYCIGSKGELIVFNEQGEDLPTISFSKPIDTICKIGNKVYINVLTRNSPKDALDVTSVFYKCEFKENCFDCVEKIYTDDCFVNIFKTDFNGKNLSALLDKDNPPGRRNEIIIFDENNSQLFTVLNLLDIENELNIDDCFQSYATNIDKNFIALLWRDELIIWNYANRQVVHRETVKTGEDVIWLSHNRLLLITWYGLYDVEF